MTQEELRKEIEAIFSDIHEVGKFDFGSDENIAINKLMVLINQHVKEVIGEVPHCDDVCKRKGIVIHEAAIDGQQALYEEQRERAGV